MLEIKKKESESNESLIRRFSRRVRQSGFLFEVKKNKYRENTPNKRKLHDDALRRNKVRSEKEYLRKIGKIEELQPGMPFASSNKKRRP